MTEQEAIKQHIDECIHRIEIIQDFTETNPDANQEECAKNINRLKVVVQALEKQIQKKPILINEREEDGVVEVEWKCPVCGVAYIELAPCHDWCPYCGNKMDWGNEE